MEGRRARLRRAGRDLAAGIVLAVPAVAGAEMDGDGLRARAERLHRDAIVVDGHNDVTSFILDYGFDLAMDGSGPGRRDATAYWIPWLSFAAPEGVAELRTDTDLRRLRAGGVDALFFSIFVHTRYAAEPGAARQRALDMIAALEEQTRRHPERLALARSAADVRRLAGEGRVAALMGLEGGHALEGDLETLRRFHALGVRYVTLTWEASNRLGDSCYERVHGGLTELGRRVVAEMNRLGMLVDVSHVSDETFWDVLETTRAPVIASHSSARALVDHPRNMSDAMLRAVAENGGVVMVNFQDTFIDPRKAGYGRGLWFAVTHLGWERTPLARAIDHVDHVVRVAGPAHVGLGSDFAGTFFMPEDFEDVSKFPNVTAELLRRGNSEEDVRGILGENLLRQRQRVRFSRLHAVWSVFLVVYLIQFWHGFWQYRRVEGWEFADLLFLMFDCLLLVALAHLSVPEVPDPGGIDLRDHHMRQAPWVFSVMGLLQVSISLGDALVGGQPFWHVENAVRAAGVGVCAGLVASRNERVHGALFGLGFGFFVLFQLLRWQTA